MPSLLGINFHKKKSSESMKGLSPLHSINREDSNHSNANHVHGGSGNISHNHPQAHHHHHNRSFNELTRFFRSSMRKKTTTSSQVNLTRSADHHSHTHSAIPPSADSSLSLSNKTSIYHDDSILAQKYGKLGKVLGSGAGGSVKVLVRPSDGRTFAVKQFRPRRAGESVKDYARKCTSEYMVGSMLHHPNVIETLDVFSDSKQNQYYEVMEYCPVDFFAVVMSGQMSRGEINCCFKQLVEGVNYLHSKGYAHRDLKLDNCVMTRDGILKLIDFGSAFVFKYTYEADEKLARGIVGSDPYLAPEVLTSTNSYSAPMVDIWSVAIIFCCMMLKRFPWKEPRLTDNNFKVYCMPDDQEHDYVKSAKEHELLMQRRREDKQREKQLRLEYDGNIPAALSSDVQKQSPHDLLSGSTEKAELKSPAEYPTSVKDGETTLIDNHIKLAGSAIAMKEEDSPAGAATAVAEKPKKQRKVIRGPYILLRLLPHASRPLMSRMLQVDPAKRATMQDILNDEWYKSISHCTMSERKHVIRAPNHSHTIVSEENTHVETYKV
ncbi:HBL314Wp [Eremothecium sinecaudum]|uniref:non-specific serine/threonine protein kinase n=1 Tax=Eremothecium sinecaudum TaxID=45286 RepID=A0A109UVZ6_9SACH|nr:HBL314Wp [Eremothecium sinecaudum]AMD18588.1 HBL314Wp [Eremothecium sinecaudum]